LNAPIGFLEEILAARAYASAKEIYDHAPDAKQLPDSIWIDRVKATEFDLLTADRAPREDIGT
jgi:hypothetical protein